MFIPTNLSTQFSTRVIQATNNRTEAKLTESNPSSNRLHELAICIQNARDAAFAHERIHRLAVDILRDDSKLLHNRGGDTLSTALGELLRNLPDPPDGTPALPQDCPLPPSEIRIAILKRGPRVSTANVPVHANDAPNRGINTHCTAKRISIEQMRALWNRHVIWWIPSDWGLTPSKPARPSPTESLLRFAIDYLQADSTRDPRAFFAPFDQLAKRDIDIPANLAEALQNKHLSFETFRAWADACAHELPPRTPKSQYLHMRDENPEPYIYWNNNLAAMFSSLVLELMNQGRITMEILAVWTDMQERMSTGKWPNLRGITNPMVTLLKCEGMHDALLHPGALQEPGILRALAASHVRFEHARYLLSRVGYMDWTILNAEIDRVTTHYRQTLQAADDPLRRAWMFSSDYGLAGRPLSAAQMQCLRESQKALEPHVHLAAVSPLSPHLDAWSVKIGETQDTLYWTVRPADELLHAWTSQAIPPDQQSHIARFLMQGFTETWARGVVQNHSGDSTRLEAWFDFSHGYDLRYRLDVAMRAAMARWLDDTGIGFDVLRLLPKMIQSGLDADRIDQILYCGVSLNRLLTAFGPGAKTTVLLEYGLITVETLYDWLNDGSIAEEELETRLGQAPDDISPLRREAADTRARLRKSLHALETAVAMTHADTKHTRHCMTLLSTWRAAISTLDQLLQPSLETQAAADPAEIEACVLSLCTDLQSWGRGPRAGATFRNPTMRA